MHTGALQTQHRIARATATLLGGNVLMLALQTLQFVLLARCLGAAAFGQVAAANALIAIAIPLAGLGFGNVLLMRVSTDRSRVRVEWGNSQVATIVIGLALAAAVTALAAGVYGGAPNAWLVGTMAVTELVAVRSLTALGQLYQSLDKVEITSAVNIGVGACRVGAIVLLMSMERHEALVWAGAACVLLFVYAAAAQLKTARSIGAPRVSFPLLWSSRNDAVHFSLGTGAKALYTDLDKVFLGHSAPAAELGAYTAAYRLVVMAFLPVRSLLDASATNFFRQGAHSLADSYTLTRRLLRVTLPYGLCAGLLLVLAGGWAPRVLGPSFEASSSMLYALAALPLIQSVHYVFSDALTSAGLQRVRTRLQWAVACVYALAAAVAIPRYGWKGAVAVCVSSELLLALLVTAAVTRRVRAR